MPETTSDGEGKFSLKAVEADWYTLRVIAKGHGAVELWNVPAAGPALAVRMKRAIPLTGVVREDDGKAEDTGDGEGDGAEEGAGDTEKGTGDGDGR